MAYPFAPAAPAAHNVELMGPQPVAAPGWTAASGTDEATILLATVATLPFAGGYFLGSLFRNMNGIITGDITRDIGIGAGGLGLLTSVYLMMLAVAQLPVGMLLDRYGPRRVQSTLFLCAATGAALIAIREGFIALLIGRALIGLGTAGGLAAGLKAIAQSFPRERLAIVNSMFIMCGGLGALAATSPLQMLLRMTDWRALFVILSLAAIAIAFLVTVSPGVVMPARKAVLAEDQPRLRDVFRDPMFCRFAPLSASCFGTVLAWQGLWAGPWLADADGLSHPEVASGLAWMAIALIAAAPGWGILTQWLRPRVKLANVAAGAALVLMATESLILFHPGAALVLPWCIFALFGGITVLSYSVLAEHFRVEVIGRANGALNVLHIGFAFAIQLLTGQIIALWHPLHGHYPLPAYQASLLLPLAMQALALAWFFWPRLSSRFG